MILATPTPLALGLTAATAAAYAWPALRASYVSATWARKCVVLAWVLHAATLLEAMLVGEPHFGFAPALSVCAWLVAAIYMVESQVFPRLQTRWALAAIGAITVVLALLFPGNVRVREGNNLVLILHLLLGLGSYALFACAAIHAAVMERAEERIRKAAEPQSGLPLLTLERLTYRFAWAGFAMLTLTLLLGTVFEKWGHSSSGWRWDHKTVFSLLAWLVFAGLLAGRHWRGWRGKKAVRLLYVGTALLLLAYVGSRFVTEVVLGHAL